MMTQETLIDLPEGIAEHKDAKFPPQAPDPAIFAEPQGIVYPVGYSAQGAAEYIDALLGYPKTILVDTRIKPYSWNERWRKEALEQQYGEKYHWAGRYLGNKALGTGNIEIADPEKGIAGLVKYLDKDYDLVLLCQCKDFDKCHVSHVVQMLLEKMPEVRVAKFTPVVPQSIGECVKCGKPATLASPGGTVYCKQCGHCQRKVYGAVGNVVTLREKCNMSVEKFVKHPRMGIYVCPCILEFERQIKK